MGAQEEGSVGERAVYYLDESMHPGVYRALRAVRDDIWFPGRDQCPVRPGAKDRDWLPVAGHGSWIVITRDKKLRTRPGERALLRKHGLRVFCLSGSRAQSKWDTLRLLLHRWPAIERIATGVPAPFFYSVTHGGGVKEMRIPEDT